MNAKDYKRIIEKAATAATAALDDKHSNTPAERARFFVAYLSGGIEIHDKALGKKIFAILDQPNYVAAE